MTMNYSLRLSCLLIVFFLSMPLDAAHASRDGIVLTTQVQDLLNRKGLYNGPIDGINGPQTKTAIQLYEEQHGFPKTGQANARLIEQLRMEIGPTVKDSSPKSNEQNSTKAESENDINKKIVTA
jgi:peptidoglycan hydrolase-like protein with peptidoglycan-binding domain